MTSSQIRGEKFLFALNFIFVYICNIRFIHNITVLYDRCSKTKYEQNTKEYLSAFLTVSFIYNFPFFARVVDLMVKMAKYRRHIDYYR